MAEVETWLIVHTQPSKEEVAIQNLIQQGYEAYCPRFKKVRRHARRVDEVLAPLFPRYVFVKVDLERTRWRSLAGTRGVSYLLMNDELHPSKISPKVIADLKSQEDARTGVVPLESLSSFVKGDRLKVLAGAFQEHEATFTGFDDKRRVQVLLNFLGRETTFSLPLCDVEAA